jgi:hypothetical protein
MSDQTRAKDAGARKDSGTGRAGVKWNDPRSRKYCTMSWSARDSSTMPRKRISVALLTSSSMVLSPTISRGQTRVLTRDTPWP